MLGSKSMKGKKDNRDDFSDVDSVATKVRLHRILIDYATQGIGNINFLSHLYHTSQVSDTKSTASEYVSIMGSMGDKLMQQYDAIRRRDYLNKV